MARVLVPLAEGCEEMEAVIVVDTLRRAKWDVVTAGLKPGAVTASRGVKLVPDTTLDAVEVMSFDAIVLPGGNGGTQNLLGDARVLDAIRALHGAGRIVAAICAAPQVLHQAGVLDGRKATCYPGVESKLTRARTVPDRVAQDGNVITSRGPGTSFEFALALIERFDGPGPAREVAGGLLVPPP